MNLNEQDFQNMNTQYDIQKRNNSRLIIFDDRFALTLWRRLKFSHRITKLIPNTKPFGFNVQGTWRMCGVNTAMRLNITKYNQSISENSTKRSLSIRYCYLHILQLKSEKSIMNQDEQKKLIEQLPVEMWISILKHLDKQDIQHLVLAFPDFQLLKIVWEAEEVKKFEENLLRQKFIPTINGVYEHSRTATSYIVQYDRNTHEVCEVEMEKLLADVFYNRNCYGSLYGVEQKDRIKRQPTIDLDHSVDRTYMTNRHQAQFIRQDLLSRFHLEKSTLLHSSDDEKFDSDMSIDNQQYEFDKLEILTRQRKHALENTEEKLVDQYLVANNNGHDYHLDRWRTFSRDDIIGYRENLLKQIEQDSGYHNVEAYIDTGRSTACQNHLIFDFDTHQLVVERLSDEMPHDVKPTSLLYDCVRQLQKSISQDNPILFYRVNVEKLAKAKKINFNLAIGHNSDHAFVLATYGGVAAL
ncbi:unnamed protein product [Rotaria socialis]